MKKLMLSVDEGCELLSALPVNLEVETLPLFEAYDRVLAEDIHAVISVPPFDKSPFDGYAFRSADTVSASRENPVTLLITEEIPAGKVPTKAISKGYAAKILTGAQVPPGADAIVKYEDTEFSETEVKIFAPVSPDSNIVHAGEDIPEGMKIAERGTVITGPVMGVLAGQGISRVKVYKKPVISIISTGSELVEVGNPLEPGKIYNTNLYTIGGLIRSLGAIPRNGGTVPDDPEVIAEQIRQELQNAAMVITTGGASVGDYDYSELAAKALGADLLFTKLSFKPGGSMLAGRIGDKVLLGLSGNPGAAAIGLLRVAMPYIKKLCGMSEITAETIEVKLKKPFKKASPQTRFLRGKLVIENSEAWFEENRSQGNGSVSSLVDCDLLVEIPAQTPPLAAGTKVKAFWVKI